MIGYRTVAKHFKLLQSQGCVKAEIAINGKRLVGRPTLFECNVFRDSLFHYPTECMSERNIRKFASVYHNTRQNKTKSSGKFCSSQKVKAEKTLN